MEPILASAPIATTHIPAVLQYKGNGFRIVCRPESTHDDDQYPETYEMEYLSHFLQSTGERVEYWTSAYCPSEIVQQILLTLKGN